ncbi:unnamed protein product [Sphenostylis stenocarpa]|uniref:Uncharacterized protein n=1 Tax=Sphenostylis stenocarpa TaxID=92480 RepID=A0AA86RMX4_9FABA|nr:unnamed protein product [Sphenostylis stenocarpa]
MDDEDHHENVWNMDTHAPHRCELKDKVKKRIDANMNLSSAEVKSLNSTGVEQFEAMDWCIEDTVCTFILSNAKSGLHFITGFFIHPSIPL